LKLESNVSFGGKWRRDELGLKGKGKLRIDGDSIILEGKQHTSPFFKILLWLASAMMTANICIVIYSALFTEPSACSFWTVLSYSVGFLLVVAVPTFVTTYFGSSPYSVRFSKKTLAEFKRNGALIRLRPSVKSEFLLFRTVNEEEAVEIQRNVEGTPE
jgi:hypothetical protein